MHRKPRRSTEPIPRTSGSTMSRRELLRGVGGLGLLTLVGCAPNVPTTKAQSTDQVPPTPDQTPSPTATPEVAKDVPKKINVPSESPIFQALSEEMQESYRSMDYMDSSEFMSLPREQQLQYSDLTYRMVEGYVSKVLHEANPDQFSPELADIKASLDNTDDEIIKRYDLRRAAAIVMMTQNGNLDEVDPNWQWRAKNYVIGIYSDSSNQALHNLIRVIESTQTISGGEYQGRILLGYTSNEVIKDATTRQRRVVFTSDYYKTRKRSSVFTLEEFSPMDASDGEKSREWSAGPILEA